MPASLANTETQAITLLRSFLIGILPTGIEIIRGEINRVAEPVSPDFCVLTPISRVRLSTNLTSYADGYFANPQVPGTRGATQPTQVTIQIDVHGPNSADNAQMVSTLLRDDYACQVFKSSGLDIAPLYAGEPRQTPFDNGESQVEFRWSVDAVLQINTVVTTGQDFADAIDVGLINVDVVYPP